MNNLKKIAFAAAIFSSLCAYSKKVPEKAEIAQVDSIIVLQNTTDSASYAIGVNLGYQFKSQDLEINPESLAQAIQDVLNNQKLAIDLQETTPIIQKYSQDQKKKKYQQNITESEKFLAENAKRKEVIVTESGLQYEILTEGNGEKPGPTDKVTVHYHGTLINGKVFDSSVNRGEPTTFGVNQVIKGWTEALQLMPAGSKWKLYIPADLAYGANPRPGGVIEPYMALVFEVELISVQKK